MIVTEGGIYGDISSSLLTSSSIGKSFPIVENASPSIFLFFLKVSRWYSSQFAADPPFVSSWSVLFLLRPSASLPSFSVSQRGSGTQGHQGGSYEDESLMEEQQRQIPGENFSRVSRFLSVNWRGRAEAVFMDGSWLTTDALTILLYCAIPTIPFALPYNATPYYTSPYESIGQPLMHYPPQAAQAPNQPSLTPLNCLAGKSGFF